MTPLAIGLAFVLGILTAGGYIAWALAPLSSRAYAERVEADCREIVVAALKVWREIEDKDDELKHLTNDEARTMIGRCVVEAGSRRRAKEGA
jgi:hypothetical protein